MRARLWHWMRREGWLWVEDLIGIVLLSTLFWGGLHIAPIVDAIVSEAPQ